MITLIKRGASYNSLISEIDGLSSETKPVTEIEGRFIENGSVYTEIDTGKKFMYDKENEKWYEITSSGGGGDSSEYAHSLELTINSQTYVLTATLKNTSDETLGTPQTIDLPLETMVVGGSYDDTTKKVILTLKNGNTVDFSVADLVSGLQSEITSSNKLNSDLVDDTNQNNKFVTSAEKTKIANALTEEVYNAGKTTPYGTQYVIAGETYTVGRNAEIFNSYDNNKAIGEYSHAEGNRTTATGSAAHAEGGALLASGTSSHAEGGGTTASGNYSHAEGSNTTASGLIAHAEGEFTNASGRNAHTEGKNTTANGECSHTEGTYTIASGNNQHVQGKYNVEDSNSKYAFIIGNGTANNNRSNAFAIDWNGLIYVNNASTGINISQLLTEEVYNAGKQVTTDGKIGEIFNEYAYNKATGADSHAEGGSTTASGHYSHAEGNATTASGNYSHAEGSYTTASGNYSHAEGNNTSARGHYSHAEGVYTFAASNNQHVQGKYNAGDLSGKYAFIIGNGASTTSRSNAFAVDWNGKIYVNNSETGVDVSAHDNALVELVDSGTKNFLKNDGTTTSTATVNSDGTIIINGTNTSAVNITLSSTTKLPAGDYVLSTENTGSNVYLTARVANDIQYACTGNTKSIPFTLNEETTLERVYLFINANTSIDNLKITPMICSKAAWDISHNYVPYRPSYDELVARITALENA